MKKMISKLIVLLLLLIIGSISMGKYYLDKYAYEMTYRDLDDFFGVTDHTCALILQDEMLEQKAVEREGQYYLTLDTVHKYLNEVFYADVTESLLLYTTPTQTISTHFGEKSYRTDAGVQTLDYVAAYEEGGQVYVAMDYIRLYTNYAYQVFDRRIQMDTQWGTQEMAHIRKNTWVRERGGVKSLILRPLQAGETVEVLEQMEKWSKVKTTDAIIGYVENKRLCDFEKQIQTPVTDCAPMEYTTRQLDEKVCLGFHAVGGMGANAYFSDMVEATKGMNVIAPTWFSLSDAEGNFRSNASAEYVQQAHDRGLQVWAVVDDFNVALEKNSTISDEEVLASTTKRTRLVQNLVDSALRVGVDGLNVDFEKVDQGTGVHFIQFLRELSVRCRKEGLVLSTDNFMPFAFNQHYRLDIQGQILDYCIMMGYDEHWHGSGDQGSVASLGFVSDGLERTLQQVPADKVINALPFYTIVWCTKGTTVSDEYLTMNKQKQYLARVDAQIVWDETSAQNYAEWKQEEATYRIWLEDEDSILAKLNVMQQKHLAGVGVWRLGNGTQEVWDLLAAYQKTPETIG